MVPFFENGISSNPVFRLNHLQPGGEGVGDCLFTRRWQRVGGGRRCKENLLKYNVRIGYFWLNHSHVETLGYLHVIIHVVDGRFDQN